MNTRTFLKSFAVGTIATFAAPLCLFGKTKVADDFELMEFSYIPAPIKFMGAEWIPTRLSLDAVIQAMVEARKDVYALVLEYHDPLTVSGLQNVHAWQVEELFCKKEDAHRVPTKAGWNGALLFDSFFHTPERERMNKDRYYVAFIPVQNGPS